MHLWDHFLQSCLKLHWKCHPKAQIPNTPQILLATASAPSQTPPRPPWNCDHDEQYQRRHCLRDVAAWCPADWLKGFPKMGGTPKWMVFFMENPSKNGWFGGKTHHFWKHPILPVQHFFRITVKTGLCWVLSKSLFKVTSWMQKLSKASEWFQVSMNIFSWEYGSHRLLTSTKIHKRKNTIQYKSFQQPINYNQAYNMLNFVTKKN